MPKPAQCIRCHLPRVAADPSPVRSRLGAECDPSFASHASPTSLLSRPSVPSRSCVKAVARCRNQAIFDESGLCRSRSDRFFLAALLCFPESPCQMEPRQLAHDF